MIREAPFAAMQIQFSALARLEVGMFCPFPRASRHRSRRVRKKLMQRSAYMLWEPCVFRLNDRLVAHPLLRVHFEKNLRAA